MKPAVELDVVFYFEAGRAMATMPPRVRNKMFFASLCFNRLQLA